MLVSNSKKAMLAKDPRAKRQESKNGTETTAEEETKLHLSGNN
jgi:hypothetical protein